MRRRQLFGEPAIDLQLRALRRLRPLESILVDADDEARRSSPTPNSRAASSSTQMTRPPPQPARRRRLRGACPTHLRISHTCRTYTLH
eukprot:2154818-Pleurochrysis_carterae.AAC.2